MKAAALPASAAVRSAWREAGKVPAIMKSMVTARSASPGLLRLTTRIARMYHERGIGQARIAEQLGLSQARVSRLLKQAEQLGIVKITVHVPEGIHADDEIRLEDRYGLDEVVLVSVEESAQQNDDDIARALGSTVASYLELTLPAMESVGVSSWSSTLLAAVNAMRPTGPGATQHIVQALGGVGVPVAQRFATRLTEHLAELTHAEPVFMLAPGVVQSLEAKQALLADPTCRQAIGHFEHLSAVLMGIGAIPPSRMLRESGNVFSEQDLHDLKQAGAVGDVCMRFFDADGQPIRTSFDDRVIGISAAQILKTRRRIGVAGGPRKFEAIRAAVRGGWISTLITDHHTGQRLLAQP